MFDNEEFGNSANGATSLFSTIVGVAIRAFLAVTTAGFFYMYGGDIWSWVLPYPMANYMAALTGIILVDGLAFAWTYLRRASADTEEQQNYAKLGAWLDMGLSLTVTGVFIILTTPLLAASVSAEVLTILTNLASWLGIIVGVVSFAGNGLVWHFFDNASSSSVQQLRTNQLRAMALRAEHTLETERLKLHTNKALSQIREALPQFALAAANKSKDNYLASRFAQIDTNGDGMLDFDEIEQAAIASQPPPQREIGYTRADRADRLEAQTHPAPPTIRPTVDPLKIPPFTTSINKDGQWLLRKSGIETLSEAKSSADKLWNHATGQHAVRVTNGDNDVVLEIENGSSEKHNETFYLEYMDHYGWKKHPNGYENEAYARQEAGALEYFHKEGIRVVSSTRGVIHEIKGTKTPVRRVSHKGSNFPLS